MKKVHIFSSFELMKDTSIHKSSEIKTEPFDNICDDIHTSISFPSFGNLQPKEIETTALFPEFPKSHEDGFATVIELEQSVAYKLAANRQLTLELFKTMQYSRSNQGGGGIRSQKLVKYFAPMPSEDKEEEYGAPMEYHVRQCGGVKVCERFEVVNHTEVDLDGPYWASLLAEQERIGANSHEARVVALYEENEKVLCVRPILGATKKCEGRTVIRSRKVDSAVGVVHCRLFIGCERWQPRESGHTYISLDKYEPTSILKLWGRDRCHVHSEILETLNFDWNEGK